MLQEKFYGRNLQAEVGLQYVSHVSVGQPYILCYLATSCSSVVLGDLFLRPLALLLCHA